MDLNNSLYHFCEICRSADTANDAMNASP